jgi:ABC-type multidrug transport system fused ATPase/permease subunit
MSDDIEKGGELEFHGIRGKIEFKNVSFSYPKSHFALKNISLEMPYGKNVAIYGKSGSGKSTIAALLVRLFDPSSGSIFIDGVPHFSFDLESFRKGIVIVSQDIPVYSGTLRENIDLKKHMKDDEILDLMKKVRLFGFLDRLPAGIDTIIAEGLVDISGGERQKLGIARALAFRSSIYIFDEVTASMDKETEKDIADLLYDTEKEITSLTITHNPDILKMMDIVYDIADGCLKRRS